MSAHVAGCVPRPRKPRPHSARGIGVLPPPSAAFRIVMYYYLSFLRPPPVSSLPTSTITITPQITNDLRTEFFEETVDILYSWTFVGQPIHHTGPVKLTTWKGASSAYKAVFINLPPSAKAGQAWSISLFCSPHTSASIPLGRPHPQPYGSSSLPIVVLSPKGALDDAAKQDEIERTLILPVIAAGGGTSPSRTLVLRERTSYDLDKKIWDSGLALAGWLCKTIAGNAPSEGGRLLLSTLNESGPCRVIELGAGTGLVSLALSALVPTLRHVSVTITDLASAIPLVEYNIQLNSRLLDGIRVTATTLDWEEELPERIISTGPFHLILMSDVTYNTASFPALLKTLRALQLLSQQEDGNTLALLAYKERDPAERDLWVMMEEMGIGFNRLDEIPGHGGYPVEIWMTYLARRSTP
ncbi:hypothetical protein CALCODRAFT_24602 [Calocera cornea HHB12733]|uniref:Methyltransferase-domain-containing protein n=1 Tax=Calocera cornea HHB12733 TaxID=1353952 RepID=A0A165J210_9BASI|nr:hypothetical protein CALCODRAFT_24602 [Calocera cornea HHB12733]